MGKIYIDIKKHTSKDGSFDYDAQTFIDANVFEVMLGISMALCDVENEVSEDDRQQFRSDFLQILNQTRNGERYAK